MWTQGLATLIGVVLGFLAGLTAVRRSGGWCPGCGVTMMCPACQAEPSRDHAPDERAPQNRAPQNRAPQNRARPVWR